MYSDFEGPARKYLIFLPETERKAKTSECEWVSGCCSGYRLSLRCRCGEQFCLLKDFCINGKQIQNICEYSDEAKEHSLTQQKVV